MIKEIIRQLNDIDSEVLFKYLCEKNGVSNKVVYVLTNCKKNIIKTTLKNCYDKEEDVVFDTFEDAKTEAINAYKGYLKSAENSVEHYKKVIKELENAKEESTDTVHSNNSL